MKKIVSFFALMIVFSFSSLKYTHKTSSWGFFSHKIINKTAVILLPQPLRHFYKQHISTLEKEAVTPDKRRYIMPDEGPRHFIDMDGYADSLLFPQPIHWNNFISLVPKKEYREKGILPWHLRLLKYQLTQAFLNKNAKRIVKLSADAGHYLGDANVPLHTTSNYNGQKTGQEGIHGFWETRLPELFYKQYGFPKKPATYIPDLSNYIWKHIQEANIAVDSVLLLEKNISTTLSDAEKFEFEERGTILSKTYSRKFATIYHEQLNGMVERQLHKSIHLTAVFWYSCWVDGGMPDL